MYEIAQQIFGLRIEERYVQGGLTGRGVWHEEVKFYDPSTPKPRSTSAPFTPIGTRASRSAVVLG